MGGFNPASREEAKEDGRGTLGPGSASERTDADQCGPAQGFLLFFRLGVRHPTNKAELHEAGCVTVTTGCQKAIQLRDSIGL